MHRIVFSACLLCSVLLLSPSVFATDNQTQDTQTHHSQLLGYQALYGDFNGDDRIDLLEISHSNEQATRFFSDIAGSNEQTDLSFHIDPATQYLVAGDFDHDDKDEFLVLNNELEGEYYLLDDALQLVEGDEKLKIKGYNENRRIAFTHLYRGDFNGDTVDDLLAYAADSHDIVVFHNKNKTNKIKFKFDAQLFLDNPSPLTVKVRDLNEDGMEDIVLLSEQSGGGTFVAFAGKKGRFKKSDFEDISPYLNGEDFSDGLHPLYFWSDNETEETFLVRPGRTPWGFDEAGNQLSDAEAEGRSDTGSASNTAYKNDSIVKHDAFQKRVQNTTQHDGNALCSRLRYSSLRKVVESSCETDAEKAADAEQPAEQGFSRRINPVDSMTVRPPEGQINASVPATPATVSADVDGDKITISWDTVTGATYYNRKVSINYGAWQNNKTYYHPQKSVIFSNQQARTYRYQVRACNNSGCSGWRVSAYVTVYAQNAVPATPGSTPAINGGNYQPFNSSGISVYLPPVNAAYTYKLYIGNSPGDEQRVITTAGNTVSFTPNISSGFLYVRYTACNLVACSDKSPWQRMYIYNVPGSPNNTALSASTLFAGGSATLTWNAAGGMIPNGFYKIMETKPGSGAVQTGLVQAGFQSSYSFTVSPVDVVTLSPANVPGEYRYRIQSCNPGMSCGSSPSRAFTLLNRAPVGNTVSRNVNEGDALFISATDYASDPDGHALTITGTTQPANGTVSCSASTCRFNATNTISSNLGGSFTYTVTDGYDGFATVTVNITVINQIEGPTAIPEISPQGGIFSGSKTISISTTTPGATIYYTTNGQNASRSSIQYTGPFTITDTTVVNAIAVAHDYCDSAQASQTYTEASTVRRTVYIHTDLLGSPVAETEQ